MVSRFLLVLSAIATAAVADDLTLLQGTDGRQGIADGSGKVLIAPEYSSVLRMIGSDDVPIFRVTRDRLSGLVALPGRQAKVLVPLEYDEISSHFTEGCAWVKKAGKYGFVDLRGERVAPLEFVQVRDFVKGMAVAAKGDPWRWGTIDREGKTVIPFCYEFIAGSWDGRAMKVRLEGREFHVDRSGSPVDGPVPVPETKVAASPPPPARTPRPSVPPAEDEFTPIPVGGGSQLVGYLGRDGKLLVPQKYTFGGFFYDGVARVGGGSSWGYIDTQGREIVPVQYDMTYRFHEGLGFVRDYQKGSFFVDTQGRFVRWARNQWTYAREYFEPGRGLEKSP